MQGTRGQCPNKHWVSIKYPGFQACVLVNAGVVEFDKYIGLHTQGLWEQVSQWSQGSKGRAPRSWWCFYNKNRICDVKKYKLMLIFV